jgi:DNA-binding LacI/PurR family transcriptional regulator
VDGLIWFKPAETAAAWVREMVESGDIPLVVVTWEMKKEGVFAAPCVDKDYRPFVEVLVRTMCEHGLHRVLVVGYETDFWTRNILDGLAKADIETSFCESARLMAGEDFQPLLDSFRPTGVIACGGRNTSTRVLRTLAALPVKERPELLLAETEQAKLRQYLSMGVDFWSLGAECSLGEAAARMLVDHLTNGRPLADIKVGGFEHGLKFHRP